MVGKLKEVGDEGMKNGRGEEEMVWWGEEELGDGVTRNGRGKEKVAWWED